MSLNKTQYTPISDKIKLTIQKNTEIKEIQYHTILHISKNHIYKQHIINCFIFKSVSFCIKNVSCNIITIL